MYHMKLKRSDNRNRKKSGGCEVCVLCGRETNVQKDTAIAKRSCYVEGAGQLCEACWAKVYEKMYQ